METMLQGRLCAQAARQVPLSGVSILVRPGQLAVTRVRANLKASSMSGSCASSGVT